MPQGGIPRFLPFGIRGLLGLSGGTITPVNQFAGGINAQRVVLSGLDIRGETQRLRVPSPNNRTLDQVRFIVAKSFDALQANADIQDERFRKLSTSLNSIGLTRDPSGNIVFSGSTFTVRAGTEQFTLALGGMLFGTPNTAPQDDQIPRSHCAIYVDEIGPNLKIRVRMADGTLKTATLPLV